LRSDSLLTKFMEKSEHIGEIATNLGVAYAGYRASGHWSGGITGLVALRLATAPNIPAGLAGLATLAAIGIGAWRPDGSPPDYSPPTVEEGGLNIPGAGAGGGGYVPPVTTAVNMTIAECYAAGGTIVQVYPMTDRCACQLPVTPVKEPIYTYYPISAPQK